MACPLSTIAFDQSPGNMPICLVSGDNLPIVIDLPFNISAYTFAGGVVDEFGTSVCDFTFTITTASPTGLIKASLTQLQTALIPSGATYFMKWATTTIDRTFLSGPIIAEVLQ